MKTLKTLKEIWKDVKGFEGLYQVSNLGRVKSLHNDKEKKEKIRKQAVAKHKYVSRTYYQHIIVLSKDGIRVNCCINRLVWETFVGDIPQGYQIDHIDNNPSNNRLDNLQCITVADNLRKRWIDNPQMKVGLDKTPIKCINTNIIYQSQLEAERQLGISHSGINQQLSGKIKTFHGLKFKYV